MKADYIVAIDPDCDKSGVATLRTSDKYIVCESLTFPKLLDYLFVCKGMAEKTESTFLVVVEAGWLNDSNWHLQPKDTKAVAAAKGNAVGRNHETGRKIVEMCKHYDMNVHEQKPLRKVWFSKDGKISHDEIAYFIPGFPKKSNQEVRDAALLAWNYAGFPIRAKVLKK